MSYRPNLHRASSLICLTFFYTLIFTLTARAWNELGHMLVGQIADNKITREQSDDFRSTLLTLLKKTGEYFTSLPDKHFEAGQFATLATAATFMDTYSGKVYSTKLYHYIDYPYLPLDALETMGYPPIARDPINFPNVSSQLNDSVSQLIKSRADIENGEVSDEVAMAFVQLLHFAGDSHQPLHNMALFNSQFPDGDRGGNKFAIKPVGDIRELHAFWDAMGTAYPYRHWYDKDAQTQVNADVKDLDNYVQSHTPPASIARIPVTSDIWRRSMILRAAAPAGIYNGIKPGQALPQSYIDYVQTMSKFLMFYAGEFLAELLVYALKGDIPKHRAFRKQYFAPLYNLKHQQQNRNVLQRIISRELKMPIEQIHTNKVDENRLLR